MTNILKSFSELFFPRLCICCDKRLWEGELFICPSCKLDIPKTEQFGSKSLENIFAGHFPFSEVSAFAYFSKKGVIQRIIHEIKYKNNPELAIYIGKLCGRDILDKKLFTEIDVIIPVPLHKDRLKKRGYNQSLLIAKGISEIIGVPIDTTSLIRQINNTSQTKKNRSERWENSEDIFSVTNKTLLANKHILLIDDIITTGATIEVCSKQLLKCENSKLSIYSVGVAI